MQTAKEINQDYFGLGIFLQQHENVLDLFMIRLATNVTKSTSFSAKLLH
jgi:hypothetical protein